MFSWFKKSMVYIVRLSMEDHSTNIESFSKLEDAYAFVMECNKNAFCEVYYPLEVLKDKASGSYGITGFNTGEDEYYIDIMEVQ